MELQVILRSYRFLIQFFHVPLQSLVQSPLIAVAADQGGPLLLVPRYL